MSDIPDYHVTVKVKNNKMLQAIKEAGYNSFNKLAKDAGVSPQTISAYLGLKSTPLKNRQKHEGCVFEHEYKTTVEKIAVCLGRSVESLFPEQHMQECLGKNESSFKLNGKEVERLMSEFFPHEVLDVEEECFNSEVVSIIQQDLNSGRFTDREKEVIWNRFLYGYTLKECAQKYGVFAERIRQIEAKALRKLRDPKRKLGQIRKDFH